MDRTTAVLAADLHHVPRRVVSRVLDGFFVAFRRTILEGHEIILHGLGTFTKQGKTITFGAHLGHNRRGPIG